MNFYLRIQAKNLHNASSTLMIPRKWLICACKSLHVDNECLYDRIKYYLNEFVAVVVCKCARHLTGNYQKNTSKDMIYLTFIELLNFIKVIFAKSQSNIAN